MANLSEAYDRAKATIEANRQAQEEPSVFEGIISGFANEISADVDPANADKPLGSFGTIIDHFTDGSLSKVKEGQLRKIAKARAVTDLATFEEGADLRAAQLKEQIAQNVALEQDNVRRTFDSAFSQAAGFDSFNEEDRAKLKQSVIEDPSKMALIKNAIKNGDIFRLGTIENKGTGILFDTGGTTFSNGRSIYLDGSSSARRLQMNRVGFMKAVNTALKNAGKPSLVEITRLPEEERKAILSSSEWFRSVNEAVSKTDMGPVLNSHEVLVTAFEKQIKELNANVDIQNKSLVKRIQKLGEAEKTIEGKLVEARTIQATKRIEQFEEALNTTRAELIQRQTQYTNLLLGQKFKTFALARANTLAAVFAMQDRISLANNPVAAQRYIDKALQYLPYDPDFVEFKDRLNKAYGRIVEKATAAKPAATTVPAAPNKSTHTGSRKIS